MPEPAPDPAFDHLIPRFGARPYLVGANYVWGWEMNRLARELITNAGGEVLGERYLPLEETAVDRIVADIEQRRPSFILNNLIGPSSYAFLAAIGKLGERDPAFRPENCPVVSCDLMECELDDIARRRGDRAALRRLLFRQSLDARKPAFKARVGARYGSDRRISSVFASAYTALSTLWRDHRGGSDEPAAVRRELHGTRHGRRCSARLTSTAEPTTRAAVPSRPDQCRKRFRRHRPRVRRWPPIPI